MIAPRSKGAVLLARTGKTQEAIAQTLDAAGVKASRVAVSMWLGGSTKPSPKKRAVIADVYGIPMVSWDQPHDGNVQIPQPKRATTEPRSAPSTPRVPIHRGVQSKAEVLERMANELLDGLIDDNESTPLEQAKVMALIGQTLTSIAKLTGEFEIGKRLFRLPVWTQIRTAIYEGLKHHPEALASLEERLRKVDEDAART